MVLTTLIKINGFTTLTSLNYEAIIIKFKFDESLDFLWKGIIGNTSIHTYFFSYSVAKSKALIYFIWLI